MKFFTDNIIYFDTEFTHLDMRVGELLSIGMIKPTGEELYIELDYKGDEHPWVKDKVLPYLSGDKISHKEAQKELSDFVGPNRPHLLAYVNQFDSLFWYDLFEDPKRHPAHWIPIDFASILFANGFDPESMRHDSFFEKLGIDRSTFNHHNALDDAKLLKMTYEAFMRQVN